MGLFDKITRRNDLSGVELVLLSKEECSLCNKAMADLEPLRHRYGFALRVVKIYPGDDWFDRYSESIPVGLVDGSMIFKYHVDAERLVTALRARAGRTLH